VAYEKGETCLPRYFALLHGITNVTFFFSRSSIYKKDILNSGNIEKYPPTGLWTFLKNLNSNYKKKISL
jgi:hypothetical protein